MASLTALSVLLSVVALVGPLTPASANHPAGSELNCEPENDTNPVNTTHTITCQLIDAANAPVNAQPAAVTVLGEVDCLTECEAPSDNASYDGELDGDANDTPNDGDDAPPADDDDRADPDGSGAECVIPQGQSSCTFTYDRNDAGNDQLTFWIAGDGGETDHEAVATNDDDSVDAVAKNWEVRTATNIDCEPENEINQTNDPHTVTCTTTDQFGQPVNSSNTAANDDTAFDQTGGSPNAVNEDNTTDNNGQATVTFTDDQPGTTTTTGCIDQNNNGTCDPGEPSDDTTKEFQAGQARGVDAFPETDTNTVGDQHSITCQVFNQFGNQNNAEGTNAQTCNFEFFDGSPSDQDDNTPNTPDRACTTDASGDCTITYTSNAAGTDRVCVWLGGTTANMTGDNTNGTCGGEGLEDPSAGTESANAADTPDPNNDDQDVVQKIWQPAAGAATQINAEPETDTNPAGAGNQHIIQVAAMSAANQPTTASPIRADVVSGPDASGVAGQAEINCAQDNTPPPGSTVQFTAPQQQTHECVLTNNGTPGTDIVRVFIDADNDGVLDNNETFDEVTKIWSGAAFALALTPESDAATAGTCNEFTATVTDQGGRPVVGQNIDVLQSLQQAGNDPAENRELYFCDPTAGGTVQTGQNPATQQTNNNAAPGAPGAGAGTRFGDVQGNQQVAGSPGNNTAVHAEVGPTNQNGQVTFGIGIRCGNNNNDVSCITQATTVSVLAWVDPNDNDQRDAGEPSDAPSTKTWNPGGGGAVTGLNAEPENASNPINTQHQVTVTLTGAAGAIQGVVPNSVIVANAAGRPQGDVTNPNAGASPNANAASQSNPQSAQNIYNCTPTNAQGVSTCTFTDPNNTPAGTDTIVFYVNQAAGGTPGPDAGEPQDAVQKTWTPGPQNLDLDLQCAGTGTGDDQDVSERNEVLLGNQTPDCTNPLSDADEIFTAIVTNPAQNNVGVAGIRVDFSFGFRANGGTNTTNDATLNATGGGNIGTSPGGLVTFCITDATGRCTVTLNNASPQNGDIIEVVGAISGATGGNPNDSATKGWQTGSVQAGTITLTPRAATNQVGTQHTITATVRNQFGQPVQGADVDWQILPGSPNANVAPEVDDVTDANGNATFTYTSNVTGTDTIRAWSETGGTENDVFDGNEPSAQANKTWQTGPVTVNGVALDMDADDNDPVNSQGNPGDCDLTTAGADPARESTATNQINPNPGQATNASNFHRICAAAFQTNQPGNNGRLAGAAITFTIQGPGRIFAANNAGNCAINAVPPAGTTVTVTADNNGYAFACLYSQQVGRTTVTASAGNPAQTATGTKDWTVSPTTARFIQLCHGDVAGTTCDTAPSTNEPGDEHQLTARVTDAQGNPVANVSVRFSETGPGIFTPQGGSTANVLTDANGLAEVLLTSDVEGTSTIVAEIDPGQTGAGRGAGTDECEQPAGTNNQPAAGNCTSQTLTKIWDDIPPPPVECDDGEDNDGDGFIDFPDDPSCTSESDDDEEPVDRPDPTRVPHERRISIRFQDGTGARNNGLVVFGRVRVTDDFVDCIRQVPVNVQRRVNGRWVTKKATTTNRRGRYAVEIFDQASRYRAVAVKHVLVDDALNEKHVCLRTVKEKRHRHRR